MSSVKETIIKGVVFDLDNTLLDFMKMKQVAVRSAIRGMIEAGLEIDEDKSFDNIISLYEKIGWENQKVFGADNIALGGTEHLACARW